MFESLSVFATLAPYVGVCLLLGIIGLLECGWRLGKKRAAVEGDKARAGLGPLEGAVFGLMGLVMAFSFSGAAARFDARRQMIVQEANDVGTAWLRIDLLKPEDQPALRQMFREYLELRLESYRQIGKGVDAALAVHGQAMKKQGEIWGHAVRASASLPPSVATLMLSALNQMFDTATSRVESMKQHPPMVIFGMLLVLTLVSALLAGYGMSEGEGRRVLHMLGFAVVITVMVYVILDLEFPRMGLIRLDSGDQVLEDVLRSMGQ